MEITLPQIYHHQTLKPELFKNLFINLLIMYQHFIIILIIDIKGKHRMRLTMSTLHHEK